MAADPSFVLCSPLYDGEPVAERLEDITCLQCKHICQFIALVAEKNEEEA